MTDLPSLHHAVRRALHGTALTIVTLAALSGCASVTPSIALKPGNTDSSARASTEFHGRFAARTVRNGKDEGVQGNFVWVQQGENVQLSLVSPLGQTLAIITALPHQATLELPNQPARTAPEVDSLMQQSLGFSLPVSGLRDWLQARPAPGPVTQEERDAGGRLSVLQQDGWTVRFADYRDAGADGTPRVRRLDLSRMLDDEPLSVKLVLDE